MSSNSDPPISPLKSKQQDSLHSSVREKQAHELLRYAVDQSMEGLSIHNKEGEIIYVNPAEAALYGYQVEEVLGNTFHMYYDQAEIDLIENQYFPILMQAGKWRGTLKARKKNGEEFFEEVSLTSLNNERGDFDGLICTCRDITEKKRAQDQLNYLAHYDHLTGLANRLLFKDQLKQLVDHARRREEMVAVFYLDLDDFKHINDTLGHATGDQLINIIANLLTGIFRPEDALSRLSGDGFIIAVGGITNRLDAVNIANKTLLELDHPILLEGRQIVQRISIGISIYPEDGENTEALIRNVDIAMYRAKDDGLHDYCFYSKEMTKQAAAYLRLSSELRQAVDANQFELHYQPIIALTDNSITSFEALVRWRHPEQGLVYPDHFIPYAEKSGLIINIDRIVLKEACRQANEWLKLGYDFQQISVNISGVELNESFIESLSAILDNSGLSPQRLKLEVTESALMTRLRRPIEILEQVRELGVGIAIDDFGVGYSSLSRLKKMPFSCLKIDRSFVRDITENDDDLAIVEAIISLSSSLKLNLTAEGVETAMQLQTLRELGADHAQGYFISRPAPVDKIDDIYRYVEEL